MSCLLLLLWVVGLNALRSLPSSQVKIYSASSTRLTSTSTVATPVESLIETKLSWQPQGYDTWIWNGYKINYVECCKSNANVNKPPLLLVHGFGASVYHWRYNIPALAERYHVFAVDLLGFGLSEKPIRNYNAEVWRDQLIAFIEEVVMPHSKSSLPCVLAGNSLGGYAALSATALSCTSEYAPKNLIGGCILLNAAGRFKRNQPVEAEKQPEWLQAIQSFIQRLIIYSSFYYTNQPATIEKVLRQVYSVDDKNVDKELVESIIVPAKDPNAREVFYRVVSRNSGGPQTYIDDLLDAINKPLLLLWGDRDPWIGPKAADAIQELYPKAQRVGLAAGHCPHDEAPELVNAEICKFIDSIEFSS